MSALGRTTKFIAQYPHATPEMLAQHLWPKFWNAGAKMRAKSLEAAALTLSRIRTPLDGTPSSTSSQDQ